VRSAACCPFHRQALASTNRNGCVIDTGHIPLRAPRTGKFDAPTDDCQRGDCSWSVGAGGEILIEWGEVLVSISDPPTFCIGASAQTGFSSVRTQAGKHSVRISSDRQSIVGFRIKDREKCAATFERPLPTCHSPTQARAHTHSTHACTHTPTAHSCRTDMHARRHHPAPLNVYVQHTPLIYCAPGTRVGHRLTPVFLCHHDWLVRVRNSHAAITLPLGHYPAPVSHVRICDLSLSSRPAIAWCVCGTACKEGVSNILSCERRWFASDVADFTTRETAVRKSVRKISY
jgi:hypothetical protein